MFGTLATIDFDRGTLEFIENPDPSAAISRNLQDKKRIACDFCRSRKTRCSGGWKTCQRCEAMALECVYSEDQGRSKLQENNQSRRAATRRNTNVSISTRTVRDEPEPCARNSQVKDTEESTLGDGLQYNMFDDSCIDKSLSSSWNMDTPMQHSLDSGSSSGGNPTPGVDLTASESFTSPSTRSSTAVSSGQLSEPLMPDTSTSLLIQLGDMDTWKGPQTVHGDMAWAMNVDGPDWVGSTSESLCHKPWGKASAESDSCGCLLSSISFLERLTSRSASRENRIDRLLADVRNSMETLAIFMACELCAARVEQNMLLAMAARQLSVICKKTANCYKALRLCGLGDTNSSRQKPELDVSAGPIDISVSTYRVSQREGLHLLESLVTLHIVELQQHINTIKSRYRNQPNQGQAEAVIEAENNTKLAQVAISSHY